MVQNTCLKCYFLYIWEIQMYTKYFIQPLTEQNNKLAELCSGCKLGWYVACWNFINAENVKIKGLYVNRFILCCGLHIHVTKTKQCRLQFYF